MQIKLASPLSFIRQKDLLQFQIEKRNGANVIVSGAFTQNIKQRELDEILAANLDKPIVERVKTARELRAEAKAKEEEEKEAQRLADLENEKGNEGNKPSEKL